MITKACRNKETHVTINLLRDVDSSLHSVIDDAILLYGREGYDVLYGVAEVTISW